MPGFRHYLDAFSSMNMNPATGHQSPHKGCMLLAVLELIETGRLVRNRIVFDDHLRAAFSKQFGIHRKTGDADTPWYPFFHLRGADERRRFWHHHLKPGRRAAYEAITQPSIARIQDSIAYAYLDDDLWRMAQDPDVRGRLRSALIERLEKGAQTSTKQRIWSWEECEAAVTSYFDMLLLEAHGEDYSKAAHRRDLMSILDGRPEGSIEYKHQNISAILIEAGLPYISGYKPAVNYQALLKGVVTQYIENHHDQIEKVLRSSHRIQAPSRLRDAGPGYDWSTEVDPPPPLGSPPREVPRVYQPRLFDYAARERRNRALGQAGERFIFEHERDRLTNAGRPDLAEEVEWTSQTMGDGAGYDIRSFLEAEDRESFIEVKTTTQGIYQPFYVTRNELEFSKDHGDQYRLARLFEFQRAPRFFQISGDLEQHLLLTPTLFRATTS